jgi:hypothetical protein
MSAFQPYSDQVSIPLLPLQLLLCLDETPERLRMAVTVWWEDRATSLRHLVGEVEPVA